MSEAAGISRGLKTLGIAATGLQVRQLDQLVAQLQKWNKAYNLTAIRSSSMSVSLHILDSLSILPFVTGPKLLDVGSGGGFPGLPLAILRPALAVTLLDSNQKKTRFLQQMKIELELANCSVVHSRVEDHTGEYQQITCRAFASLADIALKTAHLVPPGGEVLAMKGRFEAQDATGLQDGIRLAKVHSLNVPGVPAERHLVVLERARLEEL